MQGVATWLDLALASTNGRQRSIRVHDIGSGSAGHCYALSVDDRLLHAGGGELTVFHGLGSALHFLKAAGVEAFEPGAARHDAIACCRGNCLCLDGRRKLGPCPHAAARRCMTAEC